MPHLYRESLSTQKYWLRLNLWGQGVCSAERQRPVAVWAEEMRKNQVLFFWSVCSSYLNSLITNSNFGLCRLGWEVFEQQLLEILWLISTSGMIEVGLKQPASSPCLHRSPYSVYYSAVTRYWSKCFRCVLVPEKVLLSSHSGSTKLHFSFLKKG